MQLEHQVRCYHFLIVKIIAESVSLIRCQNRIVKYYHHGEEQLTLKSNAYQYTQAEKRRLFL